MQHGGTLNPSRHMPRRHTFSRQNPPAAEAADKDCVLDTEPGGSPASGETAAADISDAVHYANGEVEFDLSALGNATISEPNKASAVAGLMQPDEGQGISPQPKQTAAVVDGAAQAAGHGLGFDPVAMVSDMLQPADPQGLPLHPPQASAIVPGGSTAPAYALGGKPQDMPAAGLQPDATQGLPMQPQQATVVAPGAAQGTAPQQAADLKGAILVPLGATAVPKGATTIPKGATSAQTYSAAATGAPTESGMKRGPTLGQTAAEPAMTHAPPVVQASAVQGTHHGTSLTQTAPAANRNHAPPTAQAAAVPGVSHAGQSAAVPGTNHAPPPAQTAAAMPGPINRAPPVQSAAPLVHVSMLLHKLQAAVPPVLTVAWPNEQLKGVEVSLADGQAQALGVGIDAGSVMLPMGVGVLGRGAYGLVFR